MSLSAINFINSWTCHMAGSARRIVSQNKRTTARNDATNCQLRWPYRTSQWHGKTKQKQQGCGKVSTQVASGHQWLHLASLCSPLDGAVIAAHCAQNITCLFLLILPWYAAFCNSSLEFLVAKCILLCMLHETAVLRACGRRHLGHRGPIQESTEQTLWCVRSSIFL